MPETQRSVLHAGCGLPAPGKLHPYFDAPDWREVRLDIDPAVHPDIVSSITDMSAVPDASYDAAYSAHNLEHLFAHEVPAALAEFRRVLKPEGVALFTMPDLQSVAALIAEGKLMEPAYVSPAGPIAPIDILYGHRPAIALGNRYMAHCTGFTGKSLSDALLAAGFAATAVQRHPASFSLWAIGFASLPDETRMRETQRDLLPLQMPLDLFPTGRIAA